MNTLPNIDKYFKVTVTLFQVLVNENNCYGSIYLLMNILVYKNYTVVLTSHYLHPYRVHNVSLLNVNKINPSNPNLMPTH